MADALDFGIAFILPDGPVISGIVTWALELHDRLRERGVTSHILEHECQTNLTLNRDQAIGNRRTIRCGKIAYESVINEQVGIYQGVAPAVFLPSWSAEAYATCARLSRRTSQMRLIGAYRSLDEHYESIIPHYAPIIHRFIAVSQECADRLAELVPSRRNDIVVRPSAIVVPAALNRQYSPPDQPLKILFAGRLYEHQKRLRDLLEVAKALNALKVAYQLRIAGDGADRQMLVQCWENLPPSVRQNVELVGPLSQKEVSALLLRTDIAILTSAYEGTSVFMMEAAAAGCVPVVTDISGASMVVTHGETGFLAKVGDVKALAAHIAVLDADRRRLEQMGDAAHRRARQYSFEEYLPWFLNQCRDVSAMPARRWPLFKPEFPIENRIRRMNNLLSRNPNFAIGAAAKLRRYILETLLSRQRKQRGSVTR